MSDPDDFPLTVSDENQGLRLDQFLAQSFPAFSRSRWVKLIEQGAVFVDGKSLGASHKLKSGQVLTRLDTVTVEAPSAANVVFRGEEPLVLFEDEHLAVLNKPAGLTVHPGAGVPLEETVAGWLIATGRLSGARPGEALEEWEEDVLEQQRLGIVHRLDRGTSGAIVIAKNPAIHAALAAQFASREAHRLYWAVVEGDFSTLPAKRSAKLTEFLGRAPSPVALRATHIGEDQIISFASRLERDPRDRVRFRVSPGEGKRAVTHMACVAKGDKLSLVECKLETGRTHQIRIHTAFLGFPVLGDGLYGGHESTRMWLHAHTLTLVHPRTNQEMRFTAALPDADQAWLVSQGLTPTSRGDLWKELKSSSLKAGLRD